MMGNYVREDERLMNEKLPGKPLGEGKLSEAVQAAELYVHICIYIYVYETTLNTQHAVLKLWGSDFLLRKPEVFVILHFREHRFL